MFRWHEGPLARGPTGSIMGLQVHPQSTTDESSFSLVYGTEAMRPIEIGEPSLRRQVYDLDQNQHNICTT